MSPNILLEWLEVAEWLSIDDRLRRAIAARDALRRVHQHRHGPGTDDRPTHPLPRSVPAFRLPGRGVF
jgi:hypothetical protein